jgi:hypothetical protein
MQVVEEVVQLLLELEVVESGGGGDGGRYLQERARFCRNC